MTSRKTATGKKATRKKQYSVVLPTEKGTEKVVAMNVPEGRTWGEKDIARLLFSSGCRVKRAPNNDKS